MTRSALTVDALSNRLANALARRWPMTVVVAIALLALLGWVWLVAVSVIDAPDGGSMGMESITAHGGPDAGHGRLGRP